MIGLGERESNKEMNMLAGATFLVLDEYGVDVNNPEKYIKISQKMSKNQLIEILGKIDSGKVMKIIFPKLIKLMTADGTVNPKRLDFLDMIGNTFIESGTMPKELLESFLEKVNKKPKKDSKKKSSDKVIVDSYNNGNPKIIVEYKKGLQVGLCKEYWENGQLAGEGNYKDDEKEGSWKFYDENGSLDMEGNFKEGILVGLCKEYYENGQLKMETNYKDDSEHFVKSYYENGQLESEGNFKNYKEEGLWKFYNEDGSLKEEKNL
jgi:antitoxin component YwqK of YwqJK toxin-antitoxin module